MAFQIFRNAGAGKVNMTDWAETMEQAKAKLAEQFALHATLVEDPFWSRGRTEFTTHGGTINYFIAPAPRYHAADVSRHTAHTSDMSDVAFGPGYSERSDAENLLRHRAEHDMDGQYRMVRVCDGSVDWLGA